MREPGRFALQVITRSPRPVAQAFTACAHVYDEFLKDARMMRIPVTVVALLIAAPLRAQTPAEIDAYYPDLKALYEDIHRNPELAFQEEQTAAKLAARLRALGYEVATGVGRTGIVGILRNGAGPTVMLRTELDALPVAEKTGASFASSVVTKNLAGATVPVMHACGHDLHMTAWAGTAKWMAEHRQQWRGTLMLVGQPAEESAGTNGGATAMLKDGLFNRFPKPDYVIGLHDDDTMPAGTIGFHSGPFRAMSISPTVTSTGAAAMARCPTTRSIPWSWRHARSWRFKRSCRAKTTRWIPWC